MLLKNFPTFNTIAFPCDSPIPFTLRNKDFASPVPANIVANATPNSRNTNAGTVNPLPEQSANEEAAETPVNKKLAWASWLSKANANGEAADRAPTHEFKSIGTRSAPSRPSIPGKFSKYSASPSISRSHREKPKPSGKPSQRDPKFWAPKRIERRFENPFREDEIGEKGITVGSNGVAYRVPDAPFDYQYSYTETPRVKPLALREAPFVPFGPTTMPRPWTGRAPLPPSKKKLPEFDSFKLPPPNKKGVKHVQAPGPFLPGQGPKYVKSREEILGDPLTPDEVKALVESSCHSNRQLNIGRDGLTHNMLENIHAHWKRRRVCKIKCKGVSTVDMDNVCYHLEEKTGGKIIHRAGGAVYLFRGRNYNYRSRPRFPMMLWKPAAAVYPRLIERAPGGLTTEEANALRRKGRTLLPICKLGKNGVYLNLAKDVRDAFEESELVRINCQGLKPSDYKKIGAKLKDLVPCVLLSFEREHILMWRGKDWKSTFSEQGAAACEACIPGECSNDDSANSNIVGTLRLDEKFNSDSLVSASALNIESMPESDCTQSKNVVDEASYDTALADSYSEKSTGRSHFSISELAASVNSEVEHLEGKLNAASSSGEEFVEITKPSKIEEFSDEGNVQTHEELDSGVSKSVTNPYIECLGQDSLDLPLLELNEFSKPGETLFISGKNQMPEDGDTLFKTAHDKASFDYMILTGDSSEKSTESPFLASEATMVINHNFTGSTDDGSELESAKHRETQKSNNGFDGVDANELRVNGTAESSQQKRGGLDIESLWQQGIESGRVLLLDEPVLDPDIVHEKAIAFAKDAPEGPYVKHNFSSRKKPGKPWKKHPQDKTANQSWGQKTTQSNSNDGRAITSYDDVPREGLPLDELAKLLAP